MEISETKDIQLEKRTMGQILDFLGYNEILKIYPI